MRALFSYVLSLLQRKTLRNVSFVMAALLLGLSGVAVPVSATSNATMYFKSSSVSVTSGQDLAVAVRITTGGENVNAVQSDFIYPETQLKFNKIDGAGSAFGVDASSSGGAGKVSITRGSITPVTGDALVATVHFTVVGKSGEATLGFSSSSAVVRSSDNANVLGTKQDSTYTIEAASTSSPSPAPTPPTNPGNVNGDTTQTTKPSKPGDQLPSERQGRVTSPASDESEELPSTGPAAIVSGLVGAGALSYGALSYLRSRRALRDVISFRLNKEL